MKKSNTNKKPSPKYLAQIIAAVLIIGSLSALAACNQSTPSAITAASSSPAAAQETSSVALLSSAVTSSASPAAQVVSTAAGSAVAETFAAADKTLSLEGYGAKGAEADENMSIADMLMYAIQDEYLAHGEYAAIIAEFGNVSPYTNIIKSEETHISSLSSIYTTYGLVIPEDDSASHLVVPKDLLEAAKTGVQAEIDNIAMYEKFMTHTLPQDILSVFTTLKNASENHLASFENQVDRLS